MECMELNRLNMALYCWIERMQEMRARDKGINCVHLLHPKTHQIFSSLCSRQVYQVFKVNMKEYHFYFVYST